MRHNPKFIYLIGLIFCNLIWALNPVVGKQLLASHSPLQVVWLRYLSAIIALLIAGIFLGGLRSVLQRPRGRQVSSVLVIGMLTFWAGPVLQIIGLSMSHATLNAIIIAMEPLMTIAVAWFVVGERVTRAHGGFFALSLAGFVLLSGLTRGVLTVGEVNLPFVIGNLLMLLSLVGEACYSSFSRRLFATDQPHPAFTPLTAMATPLALGVCLMSLALFLPLPGSGLPTDLTASHWLGVLWLGPLATAGGYLFWNFALKHLSIASMVLTLFVQPLAGALFGTVFLGERLDSPQVIGGILIFASVVTQQVWELSRGPREIKT